MEGETASPLICVQYLGHCPTLRPQVQMLVIDGVDAYDHVSISNEPALIEEEPEG
jgi:hypothetical protein